MTLREIARTFNPDEPNEHLVASPTYTLQANKLLPEYVRLFCTELGLGRYTQSPTPTLAFTPEGIEKLTGYGYGTCVIRFGHAGNPESLESATYKSAVLDEAGQDQFREGSYDAILRRLSIYRGRLFILTTPYSFGWLKRRVNDERDGVNIEVVNFESRMNPTFPIEEWREREKDLPKWKFDMFYRGKFTRPAGQIYDSFVDKPVEEGGNICKRFPIPKHWPLWMGVDFGNINTAGLVIAEERTDADWEGNSEPTGRYFVVRTYHAKEAREPEQHIQTATLGVNREIKAYGGAHGEDGWRQAWTRAGLRVREPLVNHVEVQIQGIWTAFADRRLIIFDDLMALIEEVTEYSREIDEDGEVGQKIKNDAKFHLLAALRYVGTRLFRTSKPHERPREE